MSAGSAARVAVAVAAVALLAAAPAALSKSQLFTLTDILVLGLFAVSYNILLGYGGMLSFGHSAYFGLGAYGTALILAHSPGLPPPVAVLGGMAVAIAGGLLVGCVCVRRSGPYFSMLTLAFGMLFYTGAWKWRSLTQGDDGFGGFVPSEWFFPLIGAIQTGDYAQIYRMVLLVVGVLLALTWALMSFTPYGNAVRSVRQNEERASFLGYDTFTIKLANYMLASALAGIAGGMFVVCHNFVSTDVIGLDRSTEVVMMTYIGGTGWFFGPLLGSAFVVAFGDFLASWTERWQLVMGGLFVLMVMYMPKGFSGIVQYAARRRESGKAARGRVEEARP